MRKKVIFITGASGEVGHTLVEQFAGQGESQILTMDLHPLPADIRPLTTHIEGDLLNERLLARLVSEYEIDVIYHLAALLSTRSEITPEEAHQVNVEATLVLLKLAAEESQWRGRAVHLSSPVRLPSMAYPTRRARRCIPVCASGNGISHALCMAVTNSIVKCWAVTLAATTANWLLNNRQRLTFAVYTFPV